MVFTIRTPAERFADLPAWPYEPRYVEVGGLRLAAVDEGPCEAHPVVLLHGEPTWGYLWRHVVPPLLDARLRVVVPDQVGFGRSDKPARRDWYSYDRLVEHFTAHLDALDIGPCTLVVHDWGGPVALRWAVEHTEAVTDLVILNTALYSPGGRASAAFTAFRAFVAAAETLPVAALVQGATLRELADDELHGYEAPFPDEASQAGALALPLLVPTADDDPAAAEMHEVLLALGEWPHPCLVLWGRDDPVLPLRLGERFAQLVANVAQFETVAGSHFLQEDAGKQVGERIAAFVSRTR
ncbi:MAG: alpha/beta fold hydrolase [Actinobacteria bacterium]|nr:alpha/beta fold hydrolase [Actinomycetota bacterium]